MCLTNFTYLAPLWLSQGVNMSNSGMNIEKRKDELNSGTLVMTVRGGGGFYTLS